MRFKQARLRMLVWRIIHISSAMLCIMLLLIRVKILVAAKRTYDGTATGVFAITTEPSTAFSR